MVAKPWNWGQQVKSQLFHNMVMLHINLKGITNATTKSQIFCLQTPQTPLWLGSKGQNSTFSEHGHVAYQIKWNHDCSNMVANILPTDPPPPMTLGDGLKGQNSTFAEHGHVAYQTKGHHDCSNMVANILPAQHPTPFFHP